MTPPELASGVMTRKGNKEAHPGAVAKPRPYTYQSSATAKAKLLEKVNKAKVLTDIYKKKLAAVASLEDTMDDEDRQMDLDAAHPPGPPKTRSKRLKIYQSDDDSSKGDLQTHYSMSL
jgi:hypothetical protein